MNLSRTIRTFIPFALGVAIAASVAGSLTNISVHTWYLGLHKPSWTPPDNIFSPVWTILYAAMAIAAWHVYRDAGDFVRAQRPLTLWGIQLILNAMWPGIFFALRNPLWASVEIVVLLGFVIATTVSFFRRDRLAGLLMIPYCFWTSYAAALTIQIWLLNR